MADSIINRRRLLAGGMGMAALTGLPALTLAHSHTRLVSIGGSVTEIVIALGRKAQLKAVDTTSLYPADLADLPKVGYMRALAAEGILSLDPSIVLASDLSGPATALEQLKAAGVLTVIPDEPTPAGLHRKILAVGEALKAKSRAERLASAVDADIRQVRQAIEARLKESGMRRPRVAFMHNVGRATPIAGGRNTAAETMIGLAGGVNAFTGFEDHKPVSPEAVISAAPEIILMDDGAIRRFGGIEAVYDLPHVKGTPAGQKRHIATIDLLYTLGFGPRTAHAVLDLARIIHPDPDLPDLPGRDWAGHA